MNSYVNVFAIPADVALNLIGCDNSTNLDYHFEVSEIYTPREISENTF